METNTNPLAAIENAANVLEHSGNKPLLAGSAAPNRPILAGCSAPNKPVLAGCVAPVHHVLLAGCNDNDSGGQAAKRR
jgi:hypothetical protein